MKTILLASMILFGSCHRKTPKREPCPNPPIYIGAEGATVPCIAN